MASKSNRGCPACSVWGSGTPTGPAASASSTDASPAPTGQSGLTALSMLTVLLGCPSFRTKGSGPSRPHNIPSYTPFSPNSQPARITEMGTQPCRVPPVPDHAAPGLSRGCAAGYPRVFRGQRHAAWDGRGDPGQDSRALLQDDVHGTSPGHARRAEYRARPLGRVFTYFSCGRTLSSCTMGCRLYESCAGCSACLLGRATVNTTICVSLERACTRTTPERPKRRGSHRTLHREKIGGLHPETVPQGSQSL